MQAPTPPFITTPIDARLWRMNLTQCMTSTEKILKKIVAYFGWRLPGSITRTSTMPLRVEVLSTGSIAIHQSGQSASFHILPVGALPNREVLVLQTGFGTCFTWNGSSPEGQAAHTCEA